MFVIVFVSSDGLAPTRMVNYGLKLRCNTFSIGEMTESEVGHYLESRLKPAPSASLQKKIFSLAGGSIPNIAKELNSGI